MSRNIETIDSSLSQDPACASLLPKADVDERYNNNLFGQFKGFTITPIPNQSMLAEPTKPAPPPPTIPTVAIKTNVKAVQKCNVSRGNCLSSNFKDNSIPPTLPPLNPGSMARPLISSPVLAATTCTSVELVTSKVPTTTSLDIHTCPVPAPPITSIPQKLQRPNSTPLTNVILPEIENKSEKGNTFNKIASMLRPNSGIMRSNSQRPQKNEKNTNFLPRNQHHKANKVIDKEVLRNLEISNPILQKEIEISMPVIPVITTTELAKKNIVLRAHSMRDSNITPRPPIQTFGSMRQATSIRRPTSIPAGTRPTSPPPSPPITIQTEKTTASGMKITGYQNSQIKSAQKPIENVYDDCMNFIPESSLTKITEELPSNDNIYAIIEESIPEKSRKNIEIEMQADNEYKLPKRIETFNANTLESIGLLSEIVSEISNRNFDSIYSTSTLTRKRKKKEGASKSSENMGSNSSLDGYMNSNHYKIPGSFYSNTTGKFNSSSSTTSSGYLHPSVINIPQVEKKETDKNISDTSINLTITLKPDINDEPSRELGMKPLENPVGYKSFGMLKTRPSHLLHINKDDQTENKILIKPLLNKTKTSPNITRNPTFNETRESNLKLTRQSSDNMLKPDKQYFDSGLSLSKPSKLSDANLATAKQDASPTWKQTQLSTNKSCINLDKEFHTTISTVSVKNVPYSPKNNMGKFNSPDLVSSCSNFNQRDTKSPDVVGSNSKFNLTLKNVQKTPTLPKIAKTPTTSLKPSNITSKQASLLERKKSPVGNVNVAKSLSFNENSSKMSYVPKVSVKTETKNYDGEEREGGKISSVHKTTSINSNVASLQQKFEPNKNSSVTRTITSASNKKPAMRTTETSGIKN